MNDREVHSAIGFVGIHVADAPSVSEAESNNIPNIRDNRLIIDVPFRGLRLWVETGEAQALRAKESRCGPDEIAEEAQP